MEDALKAEDLVVLLHSPGPEKWRMDTWEEVGGFFGPAGNRSESENLVVG